MPENGTEAQNNRLFESFVERAGEIVFRNGLDEALIAQKNGGNAGNGAAGAARQILIDKGGEARVAQGGDDRLRIEPVADGELFQPQRKGVDGQAGLLGKDLAAVRDPGVRVLLGNPTARYGGGPRPVVLRKRKSR